jgi:hypothetical protein
MLVSFGDLSCMLVAGRFAIAGPALGAGKEAVYELVMAQLDAEPWSRRLPAVAQRLGRAAVRLAWPTISSPAALLRQGRLRLLSAGG